MILKSCGGTFSILDREDCLSKINNIKSKFPKDWNLPNVYLLHGALSDDEMNKLYNHPKVKCFVSLTHGEGFGRPLLEATMTGLPVVASAWSGHVDFLSEVDSILAEIGNEKQLQIQHQAQQQQQKQQQIQQAQQQQVAGSLVDQAGQIAGTPMMDPEKNPQIAEQVQGAISNIAPPQ